MLEIQSYYYTVSYSYRQMMFTQIKSRRQWEDTLTPHPQKIATEPFEEELIGYNFLRNIWGTYFFDRQEVQSEDKLDRINKIVGMMKAQVRLMITHQSKYIDDQLDTPTEQNDNEGLRFLQVELERTKEALERSKMRQEQVQGNLVSKHKKIESLQEQNSEIRNQMFDLKQAKNRCEERIIELSKKVFELERGYSTLNLSGDNSYFEDVNNTLDQYSAISIDRHDDPRPRVSLFTKRDNISSDFLKEQVRSEQDDPRENNQLCELNLNILRRNPMKQSLQLLRQDSGKEDSHFIQEMKKIKQKTDRIMEVENDRFSQRHSLSRRNTFAGTNQRPQIQTPATQTVPQTRRFRRIRC